jgi:hypothetical protein
VRWRVKRAKAVAILTRRVAQSGALSVVVRKGVSGELGTENGCRNSNGGQA